MPARVRRFTILVPLVAMLIAAMLSVEALQGQEQQFRRGDADDDGVLHVSDARYFLWRLFLSFPGSLPCEDAYDMNDDGRLNITDPVYLLNHLFAGGPDIPPPTGSVCGADPTEDVLECIDYDTCSEPGAGQTNTVGMRFERVPAGSFAMGSPESERGRNEDEQLHTVTISCDFEMQTTEVTQRQYLEVMGNNPSGHQGNEHGDNLDRPVESVSWRQAREFCRKLSELERGRTGLDVRYRLPTEAEWEYACRAGTRTRFWFGDLLECADDGNRCDEADGHMWWHGNFDCGPACLTRPVASKEPNLLGLYDMHGNVREWCYDWYGAYPSDPTVDPTGPPVGSKRVFRGSAISALRDGRSAWREKASAEVRGAALGFRVVREIRGCHLAVSD